MTQNKSKNLKENNLAITLPNKNTIEAPRGLREFLAKRGVEKISAVITGLIQNDMAKNAATLGRLVQGLARGELQNQFLRELGDLHERGVIKDNFYQDIKSKGFHSFVDILRFLDSDEVLENEKLIVLKKLFHSIIEVEVSEKQEAVYYQLFQIAKQLTSSALVVLAVNYHIYKRKDQSDGSQKQWAVAVSNELGHEITGLVEMHEEKLMELKLIGRRKLPDHSGIDLSQNFRLTDLGIRLGEYLEKAI